MTTSSICLTSKKSKDLRTRLMILEKFIELKSNECAYYRSKVHLMQIHPIKSEPSPTRSFSSSSTVTFDQRDKPMKRKSKALNQNYTDEHQRCSLDKTIQCNGNDFHSSSPVLMIHLSPRFIQSLIDQEKKKPKSKIKVQFSSELLEKLLQSTPNQQTEFLPVEAHVEMKSHQPSVRHMANAKNRLTAVKKKRHVYRRSQTEETTTSSGE